MMSTAAMNI